MKRYARTLLENVVGYAPGEQPKESGVIKLNTNENPYPPSPRVMQALQAMDPSNLRKYPDPCATALRDACARRYGAPGPDWVVVGNGMDELLAMALRAFVDPGEKVLSVYPTYTLYEVLCKIHGCALEYVDLDESLAPPESFYARQARLCFLARPNAPTSLSLSRSEVERFCAGFDGVVIIDEAYVDFADDNCMDFPERFENVIVMRTFSKSFSLAGMRVGVAVARPALIDEFMKIKDSYNVNAYSQAAALAAVEDYDYMLACAARVRTDRERMRTALIEMGFAVPPSQSNFLLAQWNRQPRAKELFEALREKRILVRYFNQPRLENALRISVGTAEECDALLNALRALL